MLIVYSKYILLSKLSPSPNWLHGGSMECWDSANCLPELVCTMWLECWDGVIGITQLDRMYPEQTVHSDDTRDLTSWKCSGCARLASDVGYDPCTTAATGNCKNAPCFKCVCRQVFHSPPLVNMVREYSDGQRWQSHHKAPARGHSYTHTSAIYS